MHFQIRRSYHTTVALAARLEQIVIGLWEFLWSQLFRGWELLYEILCKRRTSEYALKNGVHKASVADVAQAHWRVAVAFAVWQGDLPNWFHWWDIFRALVHSAVFWLFFGIRVPRPLPTVFSRVTANITTFKPLIAVFALFLLMTTRSICALIVSTVSWGPFYLLRRVLVAFHQPKSFCASAWILSKKRIYTNKEERLKHFQNYWNWNFEKRP